MILANEERYKWATAKPRDLSMRDNQTILEPDLQNDPRDAALESVPAKLIILKGRAFPMTPSPGNWQKC